MLIKRGSSNIFCNNNSSNNNKPTCCPHTNICPPLNNLHLHDIMNENLTNSKTIDSTKKSKDKCRTW